MSKYMELLSYKDIYLKQAAIYEERKSYEMAYLSIWLVLEHGLKLFADDAVLFILKRKINAWHAFLSGNNKYQPKEIKKFDLNYKPHSIPPVSLIEELLGSMDNVRTVMEPSSKWRRKRNDIAHRATSFGKYETYKSYKLDILNAIDELQIVTSKLDKIDD